MPSLLHAFFVCLAGMILLPAQVVRGQDGDLALALAAGELQAGPSFNSCSYYYNSDTSSIRVEYKSTADADWRAAHEPVRDQPAKIYKGSLFNLSEDTAYEIRILSSKDNTIIKQAQFRTWNSNPPVARTIQIKGALVISERGTPDAWIKYTASEDIVSDSTAQDAVIVLKDAAYIILENLTIKGGKRHAILVENSENIRILNCDLSGWGRIGEQQFDNTKARGKYQDSEGNLINLDGGIQIRRSANTVVERCYMHDPRGRANSWAFSHPTGPQGVVVEYTKGGTVLRWNDMVGSDEHRWNDVIECNSNSSPEGGFYRDSDITGNFLAFGNDDGIELEGGGMNVRFIGNKVEGTLCGISLGPCLIGPQYAIGNLIVNPGDESGLALMFLKNSHRLEQHGKRFIYNNTFHGFGPSSSAFGHYGSKTNATATLGTMRNNIFVCNASRLPADWARTENFDNDLFWVDRARPSSEQFVAAFRKYGQEKNAITADPLLAAPATGNYRLSDKSPARGKAVEVPGVTAANDNLGAFHNNTTDIPLRPLALRASPEQLAFPATGGTATVTLSLPSSAAEPVSFQIRQNNVFDWFTVSPSTGNIAPGETLKLTININATKLTGRPLFRGAFLVRTPEGLSRPVTIYAKGNYTEDKRPASAKNSVYIKASGASTKARIDIPAAGKYALLARAAIKTPWEGKQSFDVRIGSTTATPSIEPSYNWNIGAGSERVVWLHSLGDLNAGKQQLSIRQNSADMKVSEYIITDAPAAFFIQERNARR